MWSFWNKIWIVSILSILVLFAYNLILDFILKLSVNQDSAWNGTKKIVLLDELSRTVPGNDRRGKHFFVPCGIGLHYNLCIVDTQGTFSKCPLHGDVHFSEVFNYFLISHFCSYRSKSNPISRYYFAKEGVLRIFYIIGYWEIFELHQYFLKKSFIELCFDTFQSR